MTILQIYCVNECSPCLLTTADLGYAALRRSSNSLASGSSHSNSPPDSPYGSQTLDRRPQCKSCLGSRFCDSGDNVSESLS